MGARHDGADRDAGMINVTRLPASGLAAHHHRGGVESSPIGRSRKAEGNGLAISTTTGECKLQDLTRCSALTATSEEAIAARKNRTFRREVLGDGFGVFMAGNDVGSGAC